MAHRKAAVVAIVVVLSQAAPAAHGQACPPPLACARRLVLVTAKTVNTSAATVQVFQRASPQHSWRRLGKPAPAQIGRAGMAWGYPYRRLRRAGEPVKREGDLRTPAGVYRIGRSFGFTASRRPRHLRVTRQTVCIDDVRSPAYNTITSRRSVGPKVGVERMWVDRRYRQGLLVDYPTNASARAGSCIFIHVWKSPGYPTHGCVALSEARVKALQDFAAAGAVLAVMPRGASARLNGCLPAVGRIN